VKYDLIIVRYGEIALKSKFVRKKFENILIKNINFALKKEKIESKIEKERGRIYIFTDKIKPTISVLKKIAGIISFSPCLKIDSKLEAISKVSLEYSKKYLKKDMNFAVRATRTGNHSYTSKDVERVIGQDILDKYKSKVDLTDPDFTLYVEIRDDIAYIFNEKTSGIGGMPVGSQDKVLCVIKNPYSILASWYILRRGCNLLFFVKKDFDLKILNSFIKRWYLKDDIIFFNKGEEFYRKINDISSSKKCKAVITDFYRLDEEEIMTIKEYKNKINAPILHPLTHMHENEINKKLKEIGL